MHQTMKEGSLRYPFIEDHHIQESDRGLMADIWEVCKSHGPGLRIEGGVGNPAARQFDDSDASEQGRRKKPGEIGHPFMAQRLTNTVVMVSPFLQIHSEPGNGIEHLLLAKAWRHRMQIADRRRKFCLFERTGITKARLLGGRRPRIFLRAAEDRRAIRRGQPWPLRRAQHFPRFGPDGNGRRIPVDLGVGIFPLHIVKHVRLQ